MSDNDVTQLTTLEAMEEFPVRNSTSPVRVIKDILAGTAGGIAQVIVGQPFDTTKVRLQTSAKSTRVIDVIRNLIKDEGPKAFYKGTLTPLIGCGVCVSVQFGINESMKRFFHRKHPNRPSLSLPEFYICGLTGGVTNSFLASPIEHVRIRLQTQKNEKLFSGPIDCIKKLLHHGALMRGLPIMMLRAGHGLGCYFLAYEALISREIQNGTARVNIKAWKLCSFGAIAGSILWVSIYPLDVIKSVIQTDDLKSPKYKNSMVKVARSLYAKEGAMAFFKGFLPTILRASPVNAATFFTFECAMRILG